MLMSSARCAALRRSDAVPLITFGSESMGKAKPKSEHNAAPFLPKRVIIGVNTLLIPFALFVRDMSGATNSQDALSRDGIREGLDRDQKRRFRPQTTQLTRASDDPCFVPATIEALQAADDELTPPPHQSS